MNWMRVAFLVLGCFAASASAQSTEQRRLIGAGRYAELERLAESEIPNPDQASTTKLHTLCLAYSRLKRYNKLLPCLDRLERRVKRGDVEQWDYAAARKENPMSEGFKEALSGLFGTRPADFVMRDATAKVHLLRAETHLDLGNFRGAVDQAWRAFHAASLHGLPERVPALGMLAMAYALGGDRPRALKFLQDLESARRTGAIDLSDEFGGYGVWLARGYIALGEFQRALDAISREDRGEFLRRLTEGIAGEEVYGFRRLHARFILHKSQLETGRVEQAKAGYEQLLKLPTARDNGDLYWLLLYDRGRIADREGNPREAIEYYKRAVDLIEQQRSGINGEASKIGFVGQRESVYQDLIAALLDEQRHVEAFEYVERSKARALVDMLAEKKDFAVPGANVEHIRTLLASSERTEMESHALGSASESTRTLSVLERTRLQIAEQAPELASLVTVTYLRAAEIQSLLPADELLLEYFADARNVYAFVVGRDFVAAAKLPGGNPTEAVQQFRRAIQNYGSETYRDAARELYSRLIAPVEKLLAKQKLLVVPHGALHYLPFNALHDGEQFLIERYSVRVLPAASVLKFLRNAPRDKPAEVLALGNPDLGDPRHDLFFAQAEAQAIAESMPRSRALVRKEATETAFRQYAGGFRIVHIASHGTFDPEAPLKSALLLARDEHNDGVLTASELYSMRVEADLVTLSACETGLGKIASGDDVVGLTRGFLYAGASSIVASLWKVDDRATGELMTAFYDALRAGTEKREALRRSQLAVHRTFPHPFYWAAFQLTGSGT